MNSAIRDAMSAGADPITRRQIYFKTTVKTEQQAQIQLGELIEKASDGRQPESAVTVAELMDEYAAIAEWDVSTRQTNEGFIRRTIKPALGHLKVREVTAGPRCWKAPGQGWSTPSAPPAACPTWRASSRPAPGARPRS